MPCLTATLYYYSLPINVFVNSFIIGYPSSFVLSSSSNSTKPSRDLSDLAIPPTLSAGLDIGQHTHRICIPNAPSRKPSIGAHPSVPLPAPAAELTPSIHAICYPTSISIERDARTTQVRIGTYPSACCIGFFSCECPCCASEAREYKVSLWKGG